jgi:hypothetical protein
LTADGDALLATAHSLHALAEQVIAADLYQYTGKIGLRVTPGGFGTPGFVVDGTHRRIRVDGVELVVEDGTDERRARLTTIGEAADLVGIEPRAPDVYTAVMPLEPTKALEIDAGAAGEIAGWFELTHEALARLSTAHGAETPSNAQLWPEHFDLAIMLGEATYGGSPPDGEVSEPYLYVSPWTKRRGDFWNERFGASLVRDDGVTIDEALEFFEEGCRRLVADPEG